MTDPTPDLSPAAPAPPRRWHRTRRAVRLAWMALAVALAVAVVTIATRRNIATMSKT